MSTRRTIILKDLSIGYRGRRSLRTVAEGINAHISSGELTCLLGSNGIGKSTLLRTLSAFQPKISGEIILQDREIETYTEKELARLVSVVLTEKPDVRNMSVRDLVALGRSPYTGFWGRLLPEDEAKVDEAIDLVRIPHIAERMVHTLSDGERQKAMIAKALAQNTLIIYLDEPTAFLDFPSKVEMMQLLHRLSRETHKTIFLSTHDLELALQIADKIWLMDEYSQIHVGTPEDLSLNGALSHFFARKGIIFDQETGLFRIENDYDRQIRLIGHGYWYSMIRKALLRYRILAGRHVESAEVVQVVDQRISYTRADGVALWVDTIEELLESIHHD